MKTITTVRLGSLGPILALMVACGSGGSPTDPATIPTTLGNPSTTASAATFTVGGTVSGLASGATVVLQNNAGSNLAVSANGAFTFGAAISSGSTYAVTVSAQPSSPTQSCTVSSGSGTASANVTNVVVTCTTATFSVGGTVAGLAPGASVVLQNNAGANLTVSANGGFTFATPVDSGAGFAVTVLTQPTSPVQTCAVSGGTGTVAAGNVSSVMVNCAANTYSVGGTITGLAAGGTVVLQNSAGGNVSLTSNGTFAFGTVISSGTGYAVTVLTQPNSPIQTCEVANGSGTAASANVTNIAVTCTGLFTVGGTVTGLATGGTVVLQNNGGDALTVSGNGAFSFSTALYSGAAYAVSVSSQPTVPGPGQNCLVTNGSGNIAGTDIANVNVSCANSDQAAPTITARSPLPDAVGSRVQGGVIRATFSEAVRTSTVNTSSFSVQGPAGPVSGTISFENGNTEAVFTPNSTIAYDATYTVSISTAVQDASGNPLSAAATWSFNSGKKIAGGQRHTCARMDDGRVKCWGDNQFGQLGYDDTTSRGTVGSPLAGALPSVNLGTGRTAVSLVAGDYHTCAILDNGDSKCWGDNTDGALGIGSTTAAIGDAAAEMSEIAPLNFGAGRRAIELALGQYFSCARLDDDSIKCWGRNDSGQLGQGNRDAIGATPDALAAVPAVSLGTGLRAVQLALGQSHACALLQSGAGARSVKCWGENKWGQLGVGNSDNLGGKIRDMGDSLPALDLGTGRTPTAVAASGGHSCAILDDGATKCWGLNTWGQVGLNSGNGTRADAGNSLPNRLVCIGSGNYCIGDQPGEMGDALTAAIPANTARLALGSRHSCAQLSNREVKCWGSNEFGQLGIGNAAGNNVEIGDQPGEMTSIVATALKPGTTVEELTSGGFHSCVWNSEKTLNCWGLNDSGQLGRNDTNNWGDDASEMGTFLVDVNLGP